MPFKKHKKCEEGTTWERTLNAHLFFYGNEDERLKNKPPFCQDSIMLLPLIFKHEKRPTFFSKLLPRQVLWQNRRGEGGTGRRHLGRHLRRHLGEAVWEETSEKRHLGRGFWDDSGKTLDHLGSAGIIWNHLGSSIRDPVTSSGITSEIIWAHLG